MGSITPSLQESGLPKLEQLLLTMPLLATGLATAKWVSRICPILQQSSHGLTHSSPRIVSFCFFVFLRCPLPPCAVVGQPCKDVATSI